MAEHTDNQHDIGKPFDCIILGGGPAGLAAAVYMGRYLRPTLLIDEKTPRTRWHRPTSHNVLGYPAGIQRSQLLDWGRAHVALYESVQTRNATVASIALQGDHFVLTDTTRARHVARGLILCPGIEYVLPDLTDIFAYAGISMHHCPECDGYKCIGKRVAVIGTGRGSAEMALNLTTWSDQITLCTNAQDPDCDEECTQKLAAANIPIEHRPITALEGRRDDGKLEALVFADGARLPIDHAFANLGTDNPVDLLSSLPLDLHKGRWIKVDHRMRTNIPRCYAAGDIVANAQTQLSVAMGTGSTAAIWLHKELLPDSMCLVREW